MRGGNGQPPPSARLQRAVAAHTPPLGFAPQTRLVGPVDDLPGDVLTDLLAVLDEALTNVARHAGAGLVEVSVHVAARRVVLQVADDGVGMAGAPRDGGLADLRRRAAWHGGGLRVRPRAGGGTRLVWAVPLR